jgi:ankyrin repeat protein
MCCVLISMDIVLMRYATSVSIHMLSNVIRLARYGINELTAWCLTERFLLNQDGHTALAVAAANGDTSVVTLLLAADVNITYKVSHTSANSPDMDA